MINKAISNKFDLLKFSLCRRFEKKFDHKDLLCLVLPYIFTRSYFQDLNLGPPNHMKITILKT